jgi:hypothetical protein
LLTKISTTGITKGTTKGATTTDIGGTEINTEIATTMTTAAATGSPVTTATSFGAGTAKITGACLQASLEEIAYGPNKRGNS